MENSKIILLLPFQRKYVSVYPGSRDHPPSSPDPAFQQQLSLLTWIATDGVCRILISLHTLQLTLSMLA